MLDKDALWVTVMELAAIAVAPVHRTFAKFVEFEDLRQSACEYAVKREKKVREYLDREDRAERRQGETALITMLRRHSERIARREKAIKSGYSVEDEYFYRPAMMEDLIKVWASGDVYLASQVFDPVDMGQNRKNKIVSEGNDLIALLADVDAAMQSLDPRTRGILTLRYADEVTLQGIADKWGITPQRVDQIAHRGIRKMIDFLGGRTPY